jgi:hypothetical protein
VPDAGDVVEEEVGEWLPDTEERNDSGGYQAKPFQHPDVTTDAAEIMDEGFQDIDSEIGDDQELYTWSDVEIEAEAVVADGGSHA